MRGTVPAPPRAVGDRTVVRYDDAVALAWQATLFGGGERPDVDGTFAGARRIDLDETAWVDHLPGWLSAPDDVMDLLVRTAPWHSGARPMYDRIVAIPRLTAWWRWHDGFPDGVPGVIETMRAALSRRYGVPFSSCGCNLYRDGSDSVAWHGDRISKAVVDPNVAIVSVGAPRTLLLRPLGGGPSRRFRLGHGDLLVMGGSSQRTWQHSIPKVAAAGARMSITFRHGMRGDPDG
jgi:alkylated DNA repair dioxygenase AlkB